MLWLLVGLMAAVVGLALAAPFLRRRDSAAPQGSAAWDRRVYRDQLAEVERDLSRGVIGQDDAVRLRNEIGRRLLDADRAAVQDPASGTVPSRRGVPLAVLGLLVLVAGAGAVYLRLGAPLMRDEPIAARLAEAQRAYETRPSQAEAEAAAKARPRPAAPADPSYVKLVEQLRAALKARPDDRQGLALLAEHEARLGNIDAAIAAQRHLVGLDGATATDHARLAALMTEAAGGLITPEAEAELAQALKMDPALPEGRYLAGLLELQNQRPDRAFTLWRDLLEQHPEGVWATPIRAIIADLAWFAGQPDYQPPPAAAVSAAATPGPDAAAVAAAGEMSEADRAQMIAGMVEGLETRLANDGGTPEEWARLIGALAVLGRTDHAREILGEARATFGGTPAALAPIDAAAAQAGLE